MVARQLQRGHAGAGGQPGERHGELARAHGGAVGVELRHRPRSMWNGRGATTPGRTSVSFKPRGARCATLAP
jgi:hypothetical protein